MAPPLTPASTFADLLAVLQDGGRVDVEFKDEVEPWAGYLDTGMRGTLVGGRRLPTDVIELDVDLRPYRDHNQTRERADYTDERGGAGFTASELGENEDRITVSADATSRLADSALMSVLPPWSVVLYQRYLEAGSPLSYTLWLETRIHVWAGTGEGPAST